jgi:hypothetical protein
VVAAKTQLTTTYIGRVDVYCYLTLLGGQPNADMSWVTLNDAPSVGMTSVPLYLTEALDSSGGTNTILLKCGGKDTVAQESYITAIKVANLTMW